MLALHYEVKGIVKEGPNVRILLVPANKVKKSVKFADMLQDPMGTASDMAESVRGGIQFDSISVPYSVWAEKKPIIGDIIELSMRMLRE